MRPSGARRKNSTSASIDERLRLRRLDAASSKRMGGGPDFALSCEYHNDFPSGDQSYANTPISWGGAPPPMATERSALPTKTTSRRSEEHTSELQSLMSNTYSGFRLK